MGWASRWTRPRAKRGAKRVRAHHAHEPDETLSCARERIGSDAVHSFRPGYDTITSTAGAGEETPPPKEDEAPSPAPAEPDPDVEASPKASPKRPKRKSKSRIKKAEDGAPME